MIINNHFESPYNKFPQDGSIPVLSKTLVKSKLSQKFWKITEKIYQNIEAQKHNNKEHIIPSSNDIPDNNININNQKSAKNNNLRAVNNKNNESNKDEENNEINKDNKTLIKEIEYKKNLIKQLEKDLQNKENLIKKQNMEKEKLLYQINNLEKKLTVFLVYIIYNIL